MKPLRDSQDWRAYYADLHSFAAEEWTREDEEFGAPRLAASASTPAASVDFSNLPPLLTLKQTAEVLGKSLRAVEGMLYRGELPARRVGKRSRRIHRDQLFVQFGIEVKRGNKTR